ncbi:MAG: FHA domain-containing serine/threonine-protein kinase [Planctomycetota bacterium]
MKSLFIEIVGDDGGAPAELPRQGRLVIGSSDDKASYVVKGQGVADVHCTIGRIKGGGWALKDLGSEFGTIVNGENVETKRLEAGDEILIGSRKLRVFSPDEAAKPSAPKAAPATPTTATPAPATTAKATPPKGTTPPTTSRRKSSSPGAEIPQITGYKVDRLLGRGGMGNVFLSTQESLQRRVALKVLKRKLASDQTFVQRFKDEARAAARLNHPNIVTVYDVGEEGGKHFLSMEFMAGGSIEARLVELGPLPWREALDVVRDAAAGLVYAESRGIVHRDIKPENLMRNQDGVTKIADLGLAVQVEQEIVDGGGGKVFGTPHFIAPEVIRGQPADARSDLYSLGVTAYRILSGHTPFEGGTSRDILRAALNDEPARLGGLVPGLPAAFEQAVHRLIEKDPEKRHPSASVLLNELERMRAGELDAPAATQGAPKRTVGLAVVGIVAAIVGVVLFGGGGGDKKSVDDTTARTSGTGGTSSTTGNGEPGDGSNGTGTPTEDGSEDGSEDDGGQDGSAGNGAAGGGSAGGGADDPPPVDVESEVEFEAQLAYQQLSDELLTPKEKVARLRALADRWAGTDTAQKALAEAAQLESGTVAVEEVAAEREEGIGQVIAALRIAADLEADPFHPGQALRAMRLVTGQDRFENDPSFIAKRRELVDEVLKKGVARGKAATAAANAAEADGDFSGTQTALRGFLAATDLPTAEDAPLLVGEGAPESLAEFQGLAKSVQERLDALAGREGEFKALREQREMTAMAGQLGASLETSLTTFDLADAAERVRGAAGAVSDADLRAELTGAADDLALAATALDTLISAWDGAGWRRRGVLDPRPEQSGTIDVVGVAPGSLMLGDGGAPTRVPISMWCGRTRALENLFRGRLARDWTADEKRGILVLLTVSATVESLRELDPALQPEARRLTESSVESALDPFREATEWAEGDAALSALAERQRSSVASLASALVARENGDWGLSAELLSRLLDERRSTWIVMLLSDGGAR